MFIKLKAIFLSTIFMLFCSNVHVNGKLESIKKNSNEFSVRDKLLNMTKSCNKDPDEDYLFMLLTEYLTLLRVNEQIKLKNTILSLSSALNRYSSKQNTHSGYHENNRDHVWLDSKELSNLVEDIHCNVDSRNRTLINQKAICPWIYTVEKREDRYPFLVSKVKCTCNSCTTSSLKYNKLYRCVPIMKETPVLVRQMTCSKDGFKEWKPTFENITISCVCAHEHKFYPLM
jgi:hypothetical protein